MTMEKTRSRDDGSSSRLPPKSSEEEVATVFTTSSSKHKTMITTTAAAAVSTTCMNSGQVQRDDDEQGGTTKNLASETISSSSSPPTTSKSTATKTKTAATTTTTTTTLSKRQVCNLISLFCCYACVISSTTLVVGTSAIILLSVDSTATSLSPLPLAMFFVGSACISLVTSAIFVAWGRKVGFLLGSALGLFGAALGMIAIVVSSPVLVIVASMPLGACNGIGFYLRYASVEILIPGKQQEQWESFVVTLVLTGGIIAAFVGPESALATRDIFGEDLLYLGTYVMIAVFNALGAVFMLTVKFPNDNGVGCNSRRRSRMDDGRETSTALPKTTSTMRSSQAFSSSSNTDNVIANNKQETATQHQDDVSKATRGPMPTTTTLASLVCGTSFLVPCAMATASWCIMAMPMSIVRVVMAQVGYTSRQSLTTIELHFLGMYGPGYVTGRILRRFGALVTSLLSIVTFLLATILNLVSNASSVATWILGLCIVGIGWNVGFSSGTVMLSNVYVAHPNFKARIQAANDFAMFLIAGATTVSTGFIYNGANGNEDGEAPLEGWKLVNIVVMAMIACISAIIVPAYVHERRKRSSSSTSSRTVAKQSNRDDDGQEPVMNNDEEPTSRSSHSLEVGYGNGDTRNSLPVVVVYHESSCGLELAYDFRSIHSAA